MIVVGNRMWLSGPFPDSSSDAGGRDRICIHPRENHFALLNRSSQKSQLITFQNAAMYSGRRF